MNSPETMRPLGHSQRGATLVTVMLIMLVITLMGLTAMRMGLSSLSLASNSQAGNILFQESDVGLVEFTRQVAATPGIADLAGGFLQPAVSATPSSDVCKDSQNLKEFNYCFTPKLATRLTSGACDVNNSNHYMTGRDTVVVQVTVKPICNTDVVLGNDQSSSAAFQAYKFQVYSTAVLPAFGSASKAQINACLQSLNDDGESFIGDMKDPTVLADLATRKQRVTVTDCLTNYGAVFTTTVNQYSYGVN